MLTKYNITTNKPRAGTTLYGYVRDKNRTLFDGGGYRWYKANATPGERAIALKKPMTVKDRNGRTLAVLKPDGTMKIFKITAPTKIYFEQLNRGKYKKFITNDGTNCYLDPIKRILYYEDGTANDLNTGERFIYQISNSGNIIETHSDINDTVNDTVVENTTNNSNNNTTSNTKNNSKKNNKMARRRYNPNDPALTSFGGIEKGWRDTGQFDNLTFTDAQKQWLDAHGISTQNALSLLQGINSYLALQGQPGIAADSHWGSQSLTALDKILNDNVNEIEEDLPPTRREGAAAGDAGNTGTVAPVSTVVSVQAEPRVQTYQRPNIYEHAFNRRLTKQWLRDRGVNTRGLGRRTIRTWRDMLNNRDPLVELFDAEYRVGRELPSSRRGSRLIKMQDPVTKFKYRNGGSLNYLLKRN